MMISRQAGNSYQPLIQFSDNQKKIKATTAYIFDPSSIYLVNPSSVQTETRPSSIPNISPI